MCANVLSLASAASHVPHLDRERLVGGGELGLVPQHFDGLGHGPELLDHGLAELGGKRGLRNAKRHSVLLVRVLGRRFDMKTPAGPRM